MKMGIIGAGGIARKMAGTIREMANVERTAIAARDFGRAQAFAKEFGFDRAYGSYDELLADPDVELVYIAIPHSLHCEWTIKSLDAGKNVLCEKPLAVSEEQARQMTEHAKAKGLLLAEAMWTRYMPSRQIINDLIDSGVIGKIMSITANLGYKIDMNERIVKPELAGGALLDLTVYPLNFASMIFGDGFESIDAVCSMTDTGVDAQNNVTVKYPDGKFAALFTTIYTLTDRRGMIYGRNGFIEVQNINNPEYIRVWSDRRHPEPELLQEIKVPDQITGYEYEVEACARAIKAGLTECREMPHAQTLEIMRQVDIIKAQFDKQQ